MTCALKNRGPFKESMVVQDGWYSKGHTRQPRMVPVPFRMAEPCVFQQHDKYNYPDCIGCSLKKTEGKES